MILSDKRVQLVRVSFFLSDFLQNPYFSMNYVFEARLWSGWSGLERTKPLKVLSPSLPLQKGTTGDFPLSTLLDTYCSPLPRKPLECSENLSSSPSPETGVERSQLLYIIPEVKENPTEKKRDVTKKRRAVSKTAQDRGQKKCLW